MTTETIMSVFLGIGLVASVGFRIFLPLFSLSLASYFNVWELNDSWLWIGSFTALVIFGVATLIEIFAYYISFVDNLLDAVAVPLATFAGTAVMVSTVVNLSPEITWTLAIIAGGGTAAAIKGSTSTTRLASTTATAGITNPLISTVETGTSIIMAVFAIFIPIIAIILILIIFWILFKVYKLFKPTKSIK